MKIVGVVLGLGCLGIAGWQIYNFVQDQRPPQVAQRRPATPAVVRPPLPPMKRPNAFFLNSLPKWTPPPPMTAEQWAKAYPAFVHEPFDKAGFSTVSLPWRFAATADATARDPAVANALAFLLSSDLHWSNADYGSPPAYQVFKSMGEKFREGSSGPYDAKEVAALIKSWNATHAVGGLFVRGGNGYVATIQIFDRDGKLVHETAFEKPQDFFAVLGDVSCDALNFFGTPANAALSAHVHRRRSENPRTLVTLGKAALSTDSTPAQLSVYDSILKEEPGFSEVRLWRAELRLEQFEDPSAYANEQALVLRSGASSIDALAELRPQYCSEPPGREMIGEWLRKLSALAGEDHPVLVNTRLRLAGSHQGRAVAPALRREDLQPYLHSAGRHPNNRALLRTLLEGFKSDPWADNALAPNDPELVGSLAWALISNRNATPGSNGYAWLRLAQSAAALGRPHHVFAAINHIREEPVSPAQLLESVELLADAQMQLCDFKSAAEAFAKVAEAQDVSHLGERSLEKAGTCAILAGNTDLIDKMSADPRINVGPSAELLKGFRTYASGGNFNSSNFGGGYYYSPMQLLTAEAEQLQGGDFSRNDRNSVFLRWLHDDDRRQFDRLHWALLEHYYKLQPDLPHRAGFYEAAEWEHPDDPYVMAAVAAWRKAGGGPALPTADEVLANINLKQWRDSQKMPAWTIIARVRKELEEHRVDAAQKIVAALEDRNSTNHVLIAWLSRRVEQAAGENKK
jgi:hypothetical protein